MKHVKRISCVLLAAVLFCTMVAWPSKPAEAEIIFINPLQEEIKKAKDGDTIDFPYSMWFHREVVIDKEVTINFSYSTGLSPDEWQNTTAFKINANNVTLNFNGGYLQGFGNKQSGDCGAIYINGYNCTIRGAKFIGCMSKDEGGAIYVDGSKATIENCYFDGCVANDTTGAGGGVFVRDNDVTIRNCTFKGCRAPNGYGGAISMSAGPYRRLRVENCRFIECSAKTKGQWIDCDNDTFIEHCSKPYDEYYYYDKGDKYDFDFGCPEKGLTKEEKEPTCTEPGWKPYYVCWCGNLNMKAGNLFMRFGPNTEAYRESWKNNSHLGYLPQKGHDFEVVEEENTISVRCKNDPEHKVSLNLAVKDTVYPGKAENAEISGNTNRADWQKYGFDYNFYYTKDDVRQSSDPVDAGTYKAVIEVKKGGVFQKKLEKSFTIDQKTITEQFTSLDKYSIKYTTGGTYNVNVTVMDGQKTLTEGTDYTVSGEIEKTGVTEAGGPYTVTIEGKGNYKGTVTEQWYITAADPLALQGTLTASPITYGDILSSSTISDTECVVKSGESEIAGTFAWEDGDIEPEVIDSGGIGYTVVFTPTDSGYGVLKTDVPVTVNPYDLSKGDSKYISVPETYTGEELKDYITVDYDEDPDLDFVKGIDYDVTAPTSVIEPGDYTATITFKGNYTGSVSKPFKVIRNLQEDDVAFIVDKYYEGEDPADATTIMLDGKKLIRGEDYNITGTIDESNAPILYRCTANIEFIGKYAGKITGKVFVVDYPEFGPRPTPPTPDPDPTPTPTPRPYYPIPTSSPSTAPAANAGTIGDGTSGSEIKISVTTKDGNATISNIPASTIESIAKTSEKPIVIDVSKTGKDGKAVSKVTIPRNTVENLVAALDTPVNVKDRFVIITDTAVVKFDTRAFVSIASQVKGDDMQIVVEEKAQDRLNDSQKTALNNLIGSSGKSMAQSFEAYIISGGIKVPDFEGGQISVGKIDFKIPAGKNARNFHVYYLPDKGPAELCTTWVENDMIFFGTGHFSDYVIVYDENMENGIREEVYRLFNSKTGEHLLTTDKNEVKVLTAAGWILEESPGMGVHEGVAIFRLFNPETGEHLYTADKRECSVLTNTRGWVYDNKEKPIMYGFKSGKGIYRLYNSSLPSVASHHYTSDKNEVKVLTTEEGYVKDNDGRAVFYLD